MRNVLISGSWGELTVDRATGNVTLYDHQGNIPDPDGEIGYSDIIRVDLAEWRRNYPGQEPDCLDVLDVGAWTDEGEYISPEYDWREDVRSVEPYDIQARRAVEGVQA